MMRKAFKVIFLLLMVVSLSSCGKIEEISIGDIKDFKVIGFKDNAVLVEVGLPVTNPSMYKIRLTDLDVKTFIEGKYIGKLIVDENIVIGAKKTETYTIPVKLKVSNILNIAFVMMNLKKGKQVNMYFEGSLTAKSFLFKREIEINEKRKVVI